MTVGELKKALEKYEDEEEILVKDTEWIFCKIKKVYGTTTGPKIALEEIV